MVLRVCFVSITLRFPKCHGAWVKDDQISMQAMRDLWFNFEMMPIMCMQCVTLNKRGVQSSRQARS